MVGWWHLPSSQCAFAHRRIYASRRSRVVCVVTTIHRLVVVLMALRSTPDMALDLMIFVLGPAPVSDHFVLGMLPYFGGRETGILHGWGDVFLLVVSRFRFRYRD